jgi:hypothetical protein
MSRVAKDPGRKARKKINDIKQKTPCSDYEVLESQVW